MEATLIALGRGIVKLLISVFVGCGVGLLTFGVETRDSIDLWHYSGPPPGFFTSMGAGLLSTAAMMTLLFFVPRRLRGPAAVAKGPAFEELPH
jgi:hypothetical protein